MSETNYPKVVKSPAVIERYETLKRLGKKVFAESNAVRTGLVSGEDVVLARKLLAQGAQETNPPVWATFWEHTFIAPEMGKRSAEKAQNHGVDIDPNEVEFHLWLHEIGRIVTPAAYFRNDLIDERLLSEFGLPKNILGKAFSIKSFFQTAEQLHLTGAKPLDQNQQEAAVNFFNSLAPTQRIINLADNLGKRDEKGLFDLASFLRYLRTQEVKYDQESPWPSVKWVLPKRPASAILQAFVVEETVKWLKNSGVNFEEIQEDLTNYGPKMVVVVRHGELENPKGMVYNRDAVMKPEDIIHLSSEGTDQMETLAQLLKQRRFNCVEIVSSPEERAKESIGAFNKVLNIRESATDPNLDDVYAPGPYREGMTMKELAEIGGDVYDESRWGQYNHERPEAVAARMEKAFWAVAQKLKVGETGVLVSHGDAIAWLLNKITSDKLPYPGELREKLYPVKGSGTLAVIDPEGKLFTLYSLTGESTKGSLY